MPTYTHHHLTAERITDDNGPAIMLTQQEGIEDSETIVLHPWQLRAACEHLGLIASDQQAEKTIATLQRRMVALRDRIDGLADWMATYSNHKHADLSHETTQLNAIADLAREWCCDFEDLEEAAHRLSLASSTSEKPTKCRPAPVPAEQAELL
jgi:hypothetical protein